jgi:hypothetical protein
VREREREERTLENTLRQMETKLAHSKTYRMQQKQYEEELYSDKSVC